MKKLILTFCMFFLVYNSFCEEKENLPIKQNDSIDVESINFDENGNVINYILAMGFFTETRDGVTYEATVGCFLCSPSRAKARCAKVLSDRIDSVNPVVHGIY